MQVTVDQDLCIACGDCIDVCPEVFDWNEEGLSHVIVDTVPEDVEDECREAVESCPTEAIKEVG
ncbi:MAG: ferredoxin [Clostridia bacterium]|nr:ferredoxin [Clostridia bacterium]